MKIRTIPQTTSTNDDLAALAREGAPEGLWLRAETQTGGRGRQGRTWSSPPGNLYASTLVRLRHTEPPAPTLALVAGVALHEVAGALAPGHGLMLKWPNDLIQIPPRACLGEGDRAAGVVEGAPAKLAGILLERERDAVVVGIGANLASHPGDLGRHATSLAALTGAAPDPAHVVEQLAEAFARWLARWRGDGLAPIRAAWLAAAHPVGTALRTAEGDGLFDGLDADGALKLRLADGAVRLIHAGDVFLI